MSYYGCKELGAAFRTVRGNTLKIAEEIPANKYDFQPAPDVRTVGRTLVHIALGPSFALQFHGNRTDVLSKIDFQELMQRVGAEEAKPRSKDEIISFLASEGDKFASFLDGLSDSFLAETVAMLPGTNPSTKTRFE